ncbi:MAG: YlxR family protein [Acidimicrobiales bacterium]
MVPRRPRARRRAGHRAGRRTGSGAVVAEARRTCIGCRRVAATGELVRVVAAPGGNLAVGRSLPGRGAWLCAASPGCVDSARRRRSFARALRTPVLEEAAAGLVDDGLVGGRPERANIEGCGNRSGKD